MEFGAFVRLGPGVEGLVHISELSHKRVFRVSDVLSEGQEVEVMVLVGRCRAAADQPVAQGAGSQADAAEKRKPAEEHVETEQTPPEPPKKRKTPLKGGIGGPSTGEQFGLKW